MLNKQAKVVGPRELQRLLDRVTHGRHPERDRVMVLLSFKAGLRAKEIAGLTWSMITDASGELSDAIALPNRASKGKGGWRAGDPAAWRPAGGAGEADGCPE
jgi:integrase/recombinase XerD